ADESRSAVRTRFPMLRQQSAMAAGPGSGEEGEEEAGKPFRCLADFVAPVETGIPDHVGAFAVTAGIGTDALARSYEQANDDYNAIIAKALADRLAEAFAEKLHQQARHDWGYGQEER